MQDFAADVEASLAGLTTEEVVPAKRLKSLVLEAAHELQRGVEGV